MTTRSDESQLIRDLWYFIENVTDDDPERTDKFFALRERVRTFYANDEQCAKVTTLRTVILTLQYCLETFEQTCACRHCDPCTRGQEDIREAIRTLEDLIHAAPERVVRRPA